MNTNPRICPSCGRNVPPTLAVCPKCGHAFAGKRRAPPPSVGRYGQLLRWGGILLAAFVLIRAGLWLIGAGDPERPAPPPTVMDMPAPPPESSLPPETPVNPVVDTVNHANPPSMASAVWSCDTNILAVITARQPATTNLLPGGGTLLHVAAAAGFVEGADALVAAGAVVDARDDDGNTPLHVAAWFGQTAAGAWLLTNGAAASAANAMGVTPLHLACSQGAMPVAMVLLEQGAAPAAAGPNGITPLHLAVYGDMRTLVANGLATAANVNVQDAHDLTPMDYALVVDNKPMGLLLKQAGGRSALLIKATCAYCQGTRVCAACRGARKVRCGQCMGTGVGSRESVRNVCARCRGSGKIAGIGGSSLRCPICQGAGTVAAARTAMCVKCGGTGRVDCPDCGGSGVCRHCADGALQAALEESKRAAAAEMAEGAERIKESGDDIKVKYHSP